MKNNILVNPFIVLLTILSLSFTSCLKDECSEVRTFVEYESIFVQPEAFRVDVTVESARNMENTGKIYFYDNYIFINEKYEGVHVINNSDPSNPQNEFFINIPGNLDIAIKGNNMYADNYADLITLDISNLQNPVLTCRDEDVFLNYSYVGERGYFVYNKPLDRKVSVDCTDPNFGDLMIQRGGFVLFDESLGLPVGANVDANGSAVETGQGGSFARFSLVNDYLYVINSSALTAFDLTNASKPMETETTSVSWAIETLFPYKNNLFIGANNGMYIYDISNPRSPQYVSTFQHAQACDPVFVKDDIAYVTLRNGTLCQNFINQLDVIDVSDLGNPSLIASYDMEHPHGLSVRDNKLYLCEGDYGLKVFETDNLEDIADNKIEHIKNIHAFDAISLNADHLLIIGEGGLYQYDTSKPSNLKELSFLSVSK